MSRNHVATAILTSLLCVAGCARGEPAPDDPPGDEAIERSSRENRYVECDEETAEQVLVLSLTIPDIMDGHPFRIPFRKAEQEGTYFGGGGSSISADGPDGGLNGFIGIESSTDASLSVRVDLIWSSGEKRGEFNKSIDIPIGKPGKKELPDARKIEWRFVAPSREELPGGQVADAEPVESAVLKQEMIDAAVEVIKKATPDADPAEVRGQVDEGVAEIRKDVPEFLMVSAATEEKLRAGTPIEDSAERIAGAESFLKEFEIPLSGLTQALLAEHKAGKLSPVRTELLAQLIVADRKRAEEALSK